MLIFCSFFLLYFAATAYGTVVLIQLGGVVAIVAGLLLICSYITAGAAAILGAGVALTKKQTEKKE